MCITIIFKNWLRKHIKHVNIVICCAEAVWLFIVCNVLWSRQTFSLQRWAFKSSERTTVYWAFPPICIWSFYRGFLSGCTFFFNDSHRNNEAESPTVVAVFDFNTQSPQEQSLCSSDRTWKEEDLLSVSVISILRRHTHGSVLQLNQYMILFFSFLFIQPIFSLLWCGAYSYPPAYPSLETL